jgi:hypothetical protein
MSIVKYLRGLETGGETSRTFSGLSTNLVSQVGIETVTSQPLLNVTGSVVDTEVGADLKSYDVATHCVRVDRYGTIKDIYSLWDIERKILS